MKDKRATLFVYCRRIMRSPYTHTILFFCCLAATILCLLSIHNLYAKLDERIIAEAERNAVITKLVESRLAERTEDVERTVLAALADSSGEILMAVIDSSGETLQTIAISSGETLRTIASSSGETLRTIAGSSSETMQTIRILDGSYQDMLDAQRRRTLESYYNEGTLVEERRAAATAFAEGRYVTANRLYAAIAAAHKDDQEAMFYQHYSLFLINKMDRDNYGQIQNAMSILERQGYMRRELAETLQFIAEEAFMNRENMP
jgi:hypothetical protein